MGHHLAVSRDHRLVIALHMKAPETLSRPWGFPWPGSNPNSEISSAASGTPRTSARCARWRGLESTATA